MNKLQETIDPVVKAGADSGFDLTVSEDKVEAYICSKGDLSSEVTLDDIKELLEMEGIKYGVVDDILITEYLAAEPIEKKLWKIAEGKAPEAGQDPEIKYHFDTDPLKIGMLKESGRIDYKDRGIIPQVNKGDLIAEKIPGTPGTTGIDIYGQTIPFPKPRDIKLLCSKGAEKSDDGLKIFAKIDGRPELLDDGKLSVSPDLQISGDVGLETGHVDFDGDIEVRGAVQDGFRVRGKSLWAKEILKAEIDIAGDIVVSRGIIGARIKAGGKLSAKHIQNSSIEAVGNIEVEKGIYDSKIEANGTCNAEQGKILSSSISAMKGVIAKEIGSTASSPCTLTVGIDNMVKDKAKNINDQIAKIKEVQISLKSLVDELQQEFDRLDKEIEDIPQEEDRAKLQRMTLKKKMEELHNVNETSQIAKIKGAIEYLDSNINQIQETMEKLFDEQNQIMEKITNHQKEIKDFEKEVEKLCDEINDLTGLSQNKKGIPVVKVSGMIFAPTHIIGPHSSLTSEEDYQHVMIREAKNTKPDSPIKWEMNVSRLR